MGTTAGLLDDVMEPAAPETTGFLEKAFEEALQRAAAQDAEGETYDDPEDLLAGLPRTNVERVKLSREHYRRNRAVMDAAVQGAMDFLRTPEGLAHVKALRASLEGAEPNPVSAELASGILASNSFAAMNSAMKSSSGGAEDLKAWGIGLSGGFNYALGLLGGIEVLSKFEHDNQINWRGWGAVSLESGLSINIGVEFSFWADIPLNGLLKGWFIDLAIPYAPFPGLFFFRYMHIMQRKQGATSFTYSGWSLQLPVGAGFPYLMLGAFFGVQKAWSRSRRASLKVVNEATGSKGIVYETPTTLQATLTNTYTDDITLATGATISLNMPSYFSQSDIENMSIDLDGWEFSNNGNTLTLTLSDGYTWEMDTKISFEITSVSCSNQPDSTDGQIGTVTATINTNSSRSVSIVVTAELDLLWESSEASICWTATLNADDFTFGDGQPTTGTATIYALPGTEIVELTTAVSVSDPTEVWTLGYVFNYNTVTGTAIPQICAAWWKQDSPQFGDNVAYSTAISEDGSTTCYYAGLSATGSSITVNVAFDSTTPPDC